MQWTIKTCLIILILTSAFVSAKELKIAECEYPEENKIEIPEWKTKQIDSTGLSFETPFELTANSIEVPEQLKSLVKNMSVYTYSSEAFTITTSFNEGTEEAVINLDGAANGAINNMKALKGVTDIKSDISVISLNEIPGRMIKGSFKLRGKSAEYTAVVYNKDKRLWLVTCIYQVNEESSLMAERIIKSVKIDK